MSALVSTASPRKLPGSPVQVYSPFSSHSHANGHSDADQLRQIVSQRDDELREMVAHLADVSRDKESTQKRASTTAHVLELKEQEILQLSQKITKLLRQGNTTAAIARRNADERAKELARADSLQRELTSLRARLESLQKQYTETESSLQELQQDRSDTLIRMDTAETRDAALRKAVEEQESATIAVEKERDDLRAHLAWETEARTIAESESIKARRAAAKMQHMLKAATAEMDSQIMSKAISDDTIMQLRQQILELETRLAQEQFQREVMERRLVPAEAGRVEAEQLARNLAGQLEQMRMLKEDAEKKRAHAVESSEALRRELDATNERANAAVKYAEDSTRRENELKLEFAQKELESQQLNETRMLERMTSIVQELDAERSARSQWHENAGNLDTQVKELTQKLTLSEQSVSKLQQELDVSKRTREGSESALSEQISKLTVEISIETSARVKAESDAAVERQSKHEALDALEAEKQSRLALETTTAESNLRNESAVMTQRDRIERYLCQQRLNKQVTKCAMRWTASTQLRLRDVVIANSEATNAKLENQIHNAEQTLRTTIEKHTIVVQRHSAEMTERQEKIQFLAEELQAANSSLETKDIQLDIQGSKLRKQHESRIAQMEQANEERVMKLHKSNEESLQMLSQASQREEAAVKELHEQYREQLASRAIKRWQQQQMTQVFAKWQAFSIGKHDLDEQAKQFEQRLLARETELTQKLNESEDALARHHAAGKIQQEYRSRREAQALRQLNAAHVTNLQMVQDSNVDEALRAAQRSMVLLKSIQGKIQQSQETI